MRGEVLHYDEAQGFGFIAGQDGARYTFSREDLRGGGTPGKGSVVEFHGLGGRARDVFPIRGTAPTSVPSIPQTPSGEAPWGAAPGAAPPAQPLHFGRGGVAATPAVQNASLWGYFWRALTTNYVNFRDRARRKEYWGFVLFWCLAMIAIAIVGVVVDAAVGNFDNLNNEMPLVTMGLIGLFFLASILPGLAICIRRQHDIGLSGWFYLLVLIPYIGSTIVFVFSLIPSQKHENKWGPVPEGVYVPPPYSPAPLTPPGTSR